VIQKFSDPPPEACIKCGKGPIHRQLSSPAIQFKGSGWYVTDYAQKGKSASASKSSEKTDKTEKSGDTKKTSDSGTSSSSTPSSSTKE
jgi:predicted nucleic acid-binding Zn ribbon protein